MSSRVRTAICIWRCSTPQVPARATASSRRRGPCRAHGSRDSVTGKVLMSAPRSLVSRRQFVLTGLTAAAWPALPIAAQSRDLATLTLKEASDLVRRRDVSPVELTRACLARIDRLRTGDQRIHHRDAGAGAGECARARGRNQAREPARAAPWRSDRAQGQHRYRWCADDGRQRRLQRPRAFRRCGRGRPVEERWRRPAGQTEPP